MLLERGRFLRGHVFMGGGGGDARNFADTITLTEVVLYSTSR